MSTTEDGHGAERVTADQLVHTLAHGGSRLLVVESGPRGGRGARLRDLLEAADRHEAVRTALVRCSPEERGHAWGVARQVLDVVCAPRATHDTATSDSASHDSEAGGQAGDASGPDALARPDAGWFAAVRDTDTLETCHRLYWLLAAAARARPLVLAVEDAHWCDGESWALLRHLALRLHQLPLLLAVTLDPAETPDDAATGLATSHESDHETVRWRAGPLTEAEVAVRLEAELGAYGTPLAAVCREQTAGWPTLVAEVARVLGASSREEQPTGEPPTEADVTRVAPPDVARAALARAGRHGQRTARALRALAVLDAPLPLAPVPALLELDRPAADDVLAALERLSYVARGPDGVLVGPPVLRRALVASLRPSERDALERATAHVLGDHATLVGRAAEHLLRTYPAGDQEQVRLLREAARRSAVAGTFSDAARYLSRALEEPPEPDTETRVLAELGAAELYQEPVSASAHLRTAVERAATTDERLRWTLLLTHSLSVTGRASEGYATARAQLGSATARSRVEVLRTAAAELFFAGLSDDAVLRGQQCNTGPEIASLTSTDDQAPRGVRLLARVERRSRAARILSGAFACQHSGELLDGIHGALAEGLEASDRSSMGWLSVAAVLLWADDLVTAERVFKEAEAEATRWNACLPRYTALWLNSLTALHAGRLERAEGMAALAVQIAGDRPWDVWRAGPALAAMRLTEERGGFPGLTDSTGTPYTSDASDATGERVVPSAEPSPWWLFEQPGDELPHQWVADAALAARGRMRAVRGDLSGALADLTAAGRRLNAIGCLNPAVSDWRSAAALVLARLERTDEALFLADEEVRLADRWGTARTRAVALRRRGLVRGGDEGLEDAGAARKLLADARFPLEEAHTLLAQGRLLTRLRERDQARTVFTEALRLAERCAAGGLAERIREQLLQVGGRPRLARTAEQTLLTPGERTVSELAAQGATNDEIAGRLFLARRTVETHLTSVYRKLGIRGRSQLTKALAGLHADAAASPAPRR